MNQPGSTVPVELLSTKLFPPRRRSGLVVRERLLGQLAAGFEDARVILADAPPGWGKTTLLAEWLDSPGAPASGWLSLDADDNDPARFWMYVVAALRNAAPTLGEAALEQLRVHGVDFVRDILLDLVNEIVEVREDVVVVLDDYHVITHRSVHESMASLIAHAPSNLHIGITTRADPPLPLPQLRARGQLLELRAAQLRFSPDEGSALFNGALALSLETSDISRLIDRTEGWAVGLQLAGLTLRDRTDTAAFIEQFAGEDRHIVDYVGTEVLDRLPAAVRRFLLETSILNRFSAPLCAAVTGSADAAELLSIAERSNLFVVPLDHSREWFRYHHLFGELLRHQLALEEPERLAELHRRAAAWYVDVDVGEAVAHAAAAADDALLSGIIRAHWLRVFNLGQLETVDRWLDLLKPDAVAADPELALGRIWVALDQGRLEDADGWLARAAAAGAGDNRIGVLRALLAFKSGDLSAARRHLVDVGDPSDEFWSAVKSCLSGITAYWTGDADAALPDLQRATDIAANGANSLAQVYSLGYRALVLAGTDPAEAQELLEETRTLTESESVRDHFVTLVAALAAHHLAVRGGDDNEAAATAARALELARRGAGRIELAAAHIANGNVTDARALIGLCTDGGPVAAALLSGAAPSRRTPTVTSTDLIEQLTERELTILRLLTGTSSNREIAGTLFISPNTLKTHVRAIYRKLGVGDRIAAVRRGRRLGLIGIPGHSQPAV